MSEMVIPKGWKKVKFGDVTKQIKTSVNAEESGLERYVAGEHMETDNLRITSWGIIGDGYLGPAFHRKFTKGQILYGSRRTYLRKVAIADFDGICANTTFVIEPKGEMIPELLPFLMQSERFTEHSIKNSKGSTNPYINWKDIAKYEFPLPPLDEQRRIADVLWAAEETLRKNEECYALGRKIKRVVKHNLLTNGFRTTQKYETKIGKLPENWSCVKLEDITDWITKGSAIRYLGKDYIDDELNGIPFIHVQNFQDGALSFEEMNYVDIDTHNNELVRSKIYPRDVLLSIAGTVGQAVIVPESVKEANTNQDIAIIRITSNETTPEYVLECINSPLVEKQIQQVRTFGTRMHLNLSSVNKLLIPLPTMEEQELIVKVNEKFDGYINNLKNQNENLVSLKRSLLNDLMYGKLHLGGESNV